MHTPLGVAGIGPERCFGCSTPDPEDGRWGTPRATRGSVRAPFRGVMRPFGIIRPRGRDADLDRAIVGAPVIEVMGCGAIRAATGRACPTDSHSGLFEHGFGTLEACQKARLKLARLAMSHSPVSPRDGVGDQASLRQAWNLTDPPTHTFEPGTRSSMSVPGTSRGRGPSSEMSTGQPESLVRESLWGPKSPHQDILIRTWARAALTNLPKFRRSGGLRLQDSIRLSSGWGSGILQIDRGEEEGTRHLALGTRAEKAKSGKAGKRKMRKAKAVHHGDHGGARRKAGEWWGEERKTKSEKAKSGEAGGWRLAIGLVGWFTGLGPLGRTGGTGFGGLGRLVDGHA